MTQTQTQTQIREWLFLIVAIIFLMLFVSLYGLEAASCIGFVIGVVQLFFKTK